MIIKGNSNDFVTIYVTRKHFRDDIAQGSLVEGLGVDDLMHLFSRIECNQFGIWGKKDNLYGRALYLPCALFNHSCLPNCVRVQSGINIRIQALRPIARGEELCISYIDLEGNTSDRRELLRKHYLFDCVCVRCLDATEQSDRIVEAMMCKKKMCSGLLISSGSSRVCASCGAATEESNEY